MRHTNLGSLIRSIEQFTPSLLQQTYPSNIIHPQVVLQLFPETHMFQVHGYTAYITVQKMLQLAVCPFLIPKNSQLDILSINLTTQPQIEDRKLHVRWRTYSPEQYKRTHANNKLSILSLLPEEYPVLMGSFEFGFNFECDKIVRHVIRNVEYMSKPDSQPICT